MYSGLLCVFAVAKAVRYWIAANRSKFAGGAADLEEGANLAPICVWDKTAATRILFQILSWPV
jgi:hypothetical protein